MLTINTNLSSLIAQGSMKSSTNKLNQAIERMTRGFKINHAKDNAANYQIASQMTTQINSLQVAEENTAMGLDMVTQASEILDELNNRVQRLRDLQEQANNGTYGEQSLKAINVECNALVDEINRIYESAEYNGITLFMAPTTLADGRVVVAKESDAQLDTTFKDLGVVATHFEIFDSTDTLVQAYDLEENDTVNDFLTTLQGHGFTTKLKDGEITISSNTGLYVAGDLADELGISTKLQNYVASTEQSYSVNVETTSANVSSTTVWTTTTSESTKTEEVWTTTTAESTQTNTIWTTTTTSTTETLTTPVTTTTEITTSSPGFINQVTVRDTSAMIALSSVDSTVALTDGVYKISTLEEMSILATMTNAGLISEGDEFVLANDIDMSSCSDFILIGTYSNPFVGVFDGNSHTLKNLTLTEVDVAIFDRVSGTVMNLGITDFELTGKSMATVSGIALYLNETGNLANCYIKDSSFLFSGNCKDGAVAGLVAYNHGNISDCYVENLYIDEAWMDGTYRGAFVEYNKGCIENCYAIGDYDSLDGYYADGSIGNINNCYNIGTLFSIAYGANNSNCYNIDTSGNVTLSSDDWDGTEFTYDLYKPVNISVIDEIITNTIYATTTTSTTETQTIYTTTTSRTTQTTTTYVTTTSSTTQTNTVWITSTVAATGGTTFEELGVDSAFKVTVVSDGTKSALTINKTTSFDEFFAQLESKGFGVSEAGGKVELNGAGDTYLQSTFLNSLLSMSALSKTEAQKTVNTDSEHLVYNEILEDVYAPGTINLMVGTTAEPESSIRVDVSFKLTDLRSFRNIGVDGNDYLEKLDNLLTEISARQVQFGAVQNRLESVMDEISIKYDNLVSSRSTIRDADIAEVSSHYIQQQILQQASATLLATANQSPSIALQLI